jgi:sulfur transfer complex TusBCD TusB component (DsrH family)
MDYVALTTEGDKVFLPQDMILAIVPSPVLGDS